jgi:hypothetical protein
LLVVVVGPANVGGDADQPADDVAGKPISGRPITLVKRDLSPPLPQLVARHKRLGTQRPAGMARALSVLRPPDLASRHRSAEPVPDALLVAPLARLPISPITPTPSPQVNFPGLDADISDTEALRVAPPDTVGAAGPDFYVQMINLVSAVFDKDGSVCGTPGCTPTGGEPFATNALWSGFTGVCELENDGDPIVLYDHLADRWLFSQFAISGGDTHQCFAISQTGDPRGAYHRYDFELSPGVSRFDDYPKIGLWPDAYVMTVNEFDSTGSVFNGVVVFAFERDEMLIGGVADTVRFPPLSCPVSANDGPCFFSLQPGHLAGAAPPPGTPNPIIMAFDDLVWGEADQPGPDGYRLWEVDFDWTAVQPEDRATLIELAQVDTAGFDSNLCGFPGGAGCIPQPSTSDRLDDLGQFTMYRAQVRDWTSHLSLVVNHTVDVSGAGQAGIRWAELRRDGSGWALHQAGTHSPDVDHRWMGSIAMNGAGDIALGYSQSSTVTYPSVVYAIRQAADPAGMMPGGEVILHAGTGSQLGTLNRWGDYSAMTVDPLDGCTFWYTQEYYETNASFDFKTRVGAFTMPFRLGATPTSIAYGNVTMPGFKTELATLTNLCGGGSTLDVTAMTLSDPSSFSIDTGTGTCVSVTPMIPTDGDCTIGVTFTPSAEGVYDETLTIDSNADTNAQRVLALSGASCSTDAKDVSQAPPVTTSVRHVACRTLTAGPYQIAGDPSAATVEFLAGEGLILQDGFSVGSGDSFVGGTDPRLIP